MNSYYKTIIIDRSKEIQDKSKIWFQYENDLLLQTFFGDKNKSKIQNYYCLCESDVTLAVNKRNELIKIFNNVQRVYYGFSLLAKIWKYKHAKVYNNEDLFLNPINENMSNVIVILQNNWKYLFPLMEIVKSTNQNLMNSPYFFAEPLSCKNPYTNIPLSKSQLYNIFFRLKESQFLMPILFYRFFLSDFNIQRFSSENTGLIREIYLNNHVKNIGKRNVFDIVDEMLKYYHVDKQIRIHRDFPSDLLLEIMRPYIKLYFESLYNLNNSLRNDVSMKLHSKLCKLIKHNPNFGRKRINLVSNKENPFKKKQKVISYNSDFPKFETLDLNRFLNNHNEQFNEQMRSELPMDNNIRFRRISMNNAFMGIRRINRRIINDNDEEDDEEEEHEQEYDDEEEHEQEHDDEEEEGEIRDSFREIQSDENTRLLYEDDNWNDQLLVTLRGLDLYDADEENNTDEIENEL